MTVKRLLYLDFDGVLHAYGEPAVDDDFRFIDNPRLFQWLPILTDILVPYPEVRVIVSSDWRYHCDDATLVKLLGPLGARFDGITPSHIGTGLSRAEQILAHAETLAQNTNWMALDDDMSVRRRADAGDRRFVWCHPETGLSDVRVQAAVCQWVKHLNKFY